MVQRRVRPLLLVLVLVAGVLAGCVSDDSPDPEDESGSDSGGSGGSGGGDGSGASGGSGSGSGGSGGSGGGSGGSGGSGGGSLTEVDENEAVFAPTWEPGRSWTYSVSGSMVGAGYDVTLGVVEVAADHYVLGADAEREFELDIIYDGGLFTQGVQFDSMAIQQNGAWQDLLGFQRATGATWGVGLFTTQFTLTKEAVTEITHAAGAAQGIRVTGEGEEQTLVIEYASDVQWITSFVWTDSSDNVVLSYELSAAQDSGATGLFRWTELDTNRVSARFLLEFMGSGTWTSDGNGDRLFVTGSATASTIGAQGQAVGRVGVARIFDPSNEVVFEMTVSDGQAHRTSATLPDEAGDYTFLAASSGPDMVMRLYQVGVTTY